MRLGVRKEIAAGERRVALIPADAPRLMKAGWEIYIEPGAGEAAGFPDAEYESKGVLVRAAADWPACDVLAGVQLPPEPPEVPSGTVLIGMCDPLGEPHRVERYAQQQLTLFALELIPRITRAQSMDVLSSMATLAGYRSVLLAASELPRIFPLLMTAAGTLAPARVLVIGAGVAGLQAIATARRLGAAVRGYDIRDATAEQIESLGARAIRLQIETAQTEDRGGYAQAQQEAVYRQQRQLLSDNVAESDVVITTALIPGKPAPLLVSADMVVRMTPGSVIVDLAAERGGNCELTQPGETIERHRVKILAPLNLPSQVPYHASQMYSRNVANFLMHLTRKGELHIDRQDEITSGTLATYQGQVVSATVRQLLELPGAAGGPK